MYKPWMTSRDLIASVKRRMAMPVSQLTFTETEILQFASEELMLASVPEVLSFHEDYFVHVVEVPLETDKVRYEIPNRAIGMKMRDLFFKDAEDNLYEMSRISSEDKAFWQGTYNPDNYLHKYYIEGNDIVITPTSLSSPSGSLMFYIFLRPNQLVLDERACIAENFVKTITVATPIAGDTITIGDDTYEAGTDFAIGGTNAITATNLYTAILADGNVTPSVNNAVVTIRYTDLSTEFAASDEATLVIQETQSIEFDQVPDEYVNPDTDETEELFVAGSVVDFLQTKPGHRTHGYDVEILSIDGDIVTFADGDVPSTFIIGDYMCLEHECIIPQIPPDLHNGLAERTCARLLASLGDQTGLGMSTAKISEMQKAQNSLLQNRVDGSVAKISGRGGILRQGLRRGRRFF